MRNDWRLVQGDIQAWICPICGALVACAAPGWGQDDQRERHEEWHRKTLTP